MLKHLVGMAGNGFVSVEALSNLVAEMHLHGINCRYLLLLYHLLKTPSLKRLVLTEACSRAAKVILEDRWRSSTSLPSSKLFTRLTLIVFQRAAIHSPSEEPYIKESVQFFNVLCRDNYESKDFWDQGLKLELMDHFSEPPESCDLHDDSCLLRQHINFPLFFMRLAQQLGLEFDYDALESHLPKHIYDDGT
jgi:hypothetical protein